MTILLDAGHFPVRYLLMFRGQSVLLGLMATALAACGGTGGGAGASPTPTPISVLAQEYSKAANKANKAEDAIYAHLSSDCQKLDPCKADFAQLSQIENTFDANLRAMKTPSSMETDR